MARNTEVPELLAEYMKACGENERWITVYEFRTYFHLDESSAHAISGFLRRIHYRPFFSYQYRVKKIQKIIEYTPQRRCINRYLVKKRPEIKETSPPSSATADISLGIHTKGLPETGNHSLYTGQDAVEICNKVLRTQTTKQMK